MAINQIGDESMDKLDEEAPEVNTRDMYYSLGNNIHDLICKIVSSQSDDDNIYHYTAANSLQNIITSQSLWITKSDFLNDRSEFKYGTKIVNEILANKAFKNLEPNTIYKIQNEIKCNLRNSFIFSFSTNSDSVNLWSNYSKFDGYNINFSSKNLYNKINSSEVYISGNNEHINIPDGPVEFFMGKVIYNRSEQINVIQEIIKQLDILYFNYKKCAKTLSGSDDTAFYIETIRLTNIVGGLLSDYIQLFKKNVFDLDQEYRLIFRLNDNVDAIKYRILNGTFIPYIEVLFNDDSNGNKGLPISGVTIGPKNNLDIAYKGLRSFLGSQGYHVKKNNTGIYIRKSNVPLRY